MTDPADRSLTVGRVHEASTADVDDAFRRARRAQLRWNALGGAFGGTKRWFGGAKRLGIALRFSLSKFQAPPSGLSPSISRR